VVALATVAILASGVVAEAKPNAPWAGPGMDLVDQRLFEIELQREWRKERHEAGAVEQGKADARALERAGDGDGDLDGDVDRVDRMPMRAW